MLCQISNWFYTFTPTKNGGTTKMSLPTLGFSDFRSNGNITASNLPLISKCSIQIQPCVTLTSDIVCKN